MLSDVFWADSQSGATPSLLVRASGSLRRLTHTPKQGTYEVPIPTPQKQISIISPFSCSIPLKGTYMPARKLTRQDLRAAAEKYKNWGKWGPNDEIGTLNYTRPEDIVAAARLVKKGKVISLALNFDNNGPPGAKGQYPAMGPRNPVHTMLRTGTDAYAGVIDKRGIRAADDMVVMPLDYGNTRVGFGVVFITGS